MKGLLLTDTGAWNIDAVLPQAVCRALENLSFSVLICGVRVLDCEINKAPQHPNAERCVKVS